MYKHFFKRFLDFWMALIALIILSPILLVITIWLHFSNKGAGVIFSQERPGMGEKIFKLYKFKSMNDAKDKEGNLLPDKERITNAGRFIRKTSIDELPQLWNVLKGDMAFIGPRPLLVRYLPYYTDKERHRHDVRPGITGLAQVSGRNNLSWEEKFALDVEYVDTLSLKNDLAILWKTILKTIKRQDIVVAPTGRFLDEERSKK